METPRLKIADTSDHYSATSAGGMKEKRWPSVVAIVLKIMLGAMFIISAVSKFVTVDAFEMYVYSFGLMGLGLCCHVTRLVIGAELVLGVALISNRYHRFTTLTALLFVLSFIVFLAYAHFIGRTDSCHCFGDLLPFDPIQSMLKNAVLVLLLLAVYKWGGDRWLPHFGLVVVIYVALAAVVLLFTIKVYRTIDILAEIMVLVLMVVGVLAALPFYKRWYVTLLPILMILTPFATIFIQSPPDVLMFTNSEERFDEELLMRQLEKSASALDNDTVAVMDSTVGAVDSVGGALSEWHLREGRHVVAFVSPTCGYCQLAAGKLSTIARLKQLDSSRVLYVFPQVKKLQSYDDFYANSRAAHFAEARIDKVLFIKITQGAFPLILLMDDGEVVASYAYRNINEKKITDFLNFE